MGAENVALKEREARLLWYGHIWRQERDNVKQTNKMEVIDNRGKYNQ